MNKRILFTTIIACILFKHTSAQPQLVCQEVDFSSQRSFWQKNIRGNKSINLKTQFSFQIHGKDFFCTRTNGLVYQFDMDKQTVIENMSFIVNDGYTEPSDYYVDRNIIAWEKKRETVNARDSIYVVKYYDYKRNEGSEKTFVLPSGSLTKSHPVIIDTNKILVDNIIFYADERDPDTLNVIDRKIAPHTEGRTFMRKNMYLTDNCFETLARCPKEFHGLSLTKIENNRMVTYDLDPKNVSVPMNTYRIEADFESLLLMSSKIEPHKFLLYDINKHFAYHFQLDNEIFNLSRLAGKEESRTDNSNDEFAPNEVRFTYFCSMDEKNIFIGAVFKPDTRVRIFKVSDYNRLIR